MKKVKICVLALFTFGILSNSFAQTLLTCEKKDFFYYGEDFSLRVFQENNRKILTYTFSSGSARLKATEFVSYKRSRYGQNLSLEQTAENRYDFKMNDPHSGFGEVKVAAINCQKNEASGYLRCQKKNGLTVEVTEGDGDAVLTVSDSEGEISYNVSKESSYTGKSHALKVSLKKSWGNIYNFRAIDTYNGDMSVNVQGLECIE